MLRCSVDIHSPAKCLLTCYRKDWDWTHAGRTDRRPSLPRSSQSHNCPLWGILKAHMQKHAHINKMTDLSLISSYHVCFCFLLLVIFSCTELLFFLLLSACDPNHFPDSSTNELSRVSLLNMHTPHIKKNTPKLTDSLGVNPPSWAVYSSSDTVLKLPQRPQVRLAWCLVSVKAMLAALSMETVKPNSSLQSL